MNKKSFVKRILAVALSIIMVLCLMPMTAFAASTSVPGAGGHVLTNMVTGTFEGGYDSTIIVYVTPNVSDSITYQIKDNAGFFAVPTYDSAEWHFAGWKTWYKGSWSGLGVTTSDKANPKYDDNEYYFTMTSNDSWMNGVLYRAGSMMVLKEDLWKGTYYLSAIFEPLVTVNAGEGISYVVSEATKRADNKYSVKYNNGLSIDYSVADGYIVTGVSANYGINYSDNGDVVSLTNIVRPAAVTVTARLKQQKVTFDANGGEGTMAQQSYSYGQAQTLTANNFTRSGYTFAGWNAKADGTSTAYTDKQPVTFTPENDGDSITLYAQWTACTNHQWENDKCTECGTVCSHTGGTATCIAQAVCTVCGQPYGEIAGHDWGNWISNSNGTHTRTCANDASHTETNDCSGGTATCTEKAECSVCTTEYGDILPHTYGTEWKSDGMNHWHECSCGAKAEEAAHSGGTATCTEKAICTVCGQPYGEVQGHDWGDWISNSNGTHTRTCANDASHTETNDCSGGTATCTEKSKCSVCATAYGDLAEHTYGTEWKSDGTNHWHECSCGAKAEEAAHSGGTATCTDKAVCSVCGIAYSELLAHNYKDGKCTVCKVTDPDYQPPTTDSPQTGDNSHLVLWLALLFISGGAVVTLTVYDRKRRTAANK